MGGSILNDTKTLLGIDVSDNSFDREIMLNINAALMVLNDLGVGPSEGFVITSPDQTWTEYIGERTDLEGVKTYVYLKTRLTFDPPQMGYLVDAIKKQIEELEWRLNVKVETKGETSNAK